MKITPKSLQIIFALTENNDRVSRFMLVTDTITYELLQEKDLEQTINCLVEVFTSAEPVFIGLKITPSEFYPFAETICKKAVKDKLSHIAKDSVTSQVIGFVISEDFSTTLSEENFQNLSEKFKPVFQLLKELHEQYELDKQIVKRKLLHSILWGVKEEYRNRHINSNLVKENNNLAIQKGFSGVVVECSGNISQHLARKQGFEDRFSIDYQTFEYQGMKVFKDIKEHQSCILMEKNFL